MGRRRWRRLWVVLALVILGPQGAHADPSRPQPASTPASQSAAGAQDSATPAPSAKSPRQPKFEVDWLVSGSVLALSTSFTLLTISLTATGEIVSQEPEPDADLLFIDKWVADADSISNHAMYISDLGVGVIASYAAFDIVYTGLSDRGDSPWTYLTMYLESMSITWALSSLVKIAVRRPRPRAYLELRQTGSVSEETEEYLSFYSGHTALTAALGATATYLSFARDDPPWMKWGIFTGAVGTTAAVGLGRLFARAHFTSDVLMGAVLGSTVGILVPYFHRAKQPVLVLPYHSEAGSGLSVSARF